MVERASEQMSELARERESWGEWMVVYCEYSAQPGMVEKKWQKDEKSGPCNETQKEERRKSLANFVLGASCGGKSISQRLKDWMTGWGESTRFFS